MAAFNDLEIKAAELLNTYVMTSNCKKIWAVLGPEFGDNTGKSAVIVRALYGLKSVGASFRVSSCTMHAEIRVLFL